MSDPADLIRLDRRLCDPKHNPTAFADFVQLAWPHIDPVDLVWERYMAEVCAHLQAVAERKIRRLLVAIPPGSSKSMLCNVMYNAWLWGPAGQPKRRLLYTSYDESLVIRDAKKCRQLIQSEWYQARWPLQFEEDSKALKYYTNSKKGYRISTTLRAGITGKHVDDAFVDDPQKPLALARVTREGESLESEVAWQFFTETLPTRFSNHADNAKVVIQQRLGESDLIGRLLEEQESNPDAERYEYLMLPMEYDPDRRSVTSVGGDWRTEPGELLAPLRCPPEALESLKAGFGGDERAIQAQLQQDPTPAGGIYFSDDMFQRYVELPRVGSYSFVWDLGLKGGDNHDPNAGHMYLRAGKDRYWLRGCEFRANLYETIPRMQEWMQECIEWAQNLNRAGKHSWVPYRILVEDKANGPAAIAALKGMRWPCKVEAWDPGRADKKERAEATAALARSVRFHMPDPDLETALLSNSSDIEVHSERVLSQLKKFPGGRHDDHVDAFTCAMLYWADSGATGIEFLRSLAKVRGV